MDESVKSIGSDEHRVDMARWAVETFEPTTPIHKAALRVLTAYLAGRPLPVKKNGESDDLDTEE